MGKDNDYIKSLNCPQWFRAAVVLLKSPHVTEHLKEESLLPRKAAALR